MGRSMSIFQKNKEIKLPLIENKFLVKSSKLLIICFNLPVFLQILNLGIKATFIIQPNIQNLTEYLEPYKTTYAGLVGMFEGQNEPELNAGLPEAYNTQLQWYKVIRDRERERERELALRD